MICLIDLFLLKPSVYRHILFNLNYPIVIQISFGSLILILESCEDLYYFFLFHFSLSFFYSDIHSILSVS
ncbi:hypothetical protein BY996DRAFT_7364532 [Phakopsora pachyrhizi]|nr:hypothetical protein BY996DRAFT_7364532 [Phakopsora pachyrhizi]